MLRTALLAIFCASAISASQAQQAVAPPAGQPSTDSAVAPPENFSTPEALARQLWRRDMARKSAPEPGCFSVTYPSTEWKETTCSTVPARPHLPRLDLGPQTAGHGNSPLATLGSNPIFSATGSLATVSGVTTETDSLAGAGAWSLQLNANTFNSATLCAGQTNSCQGWEQFIADNPGNVLIQYWLIGHTSPCPPKLQGFSDDWKYAPPITTPPTSAGGCYVNGHQTPATKQTLSQLQGMRLTGTSSSTTQSVTLETADNEMFTAKDAGDPLSIGTQWRQAEFNIFGLSDSSEANFNSGASIVVRIDVYYPGIVAPACPIGGFTAETNNLNPFSPCAGYDGQPNISDPGVQFTEDLIPPIAGCAYPSLATAAPTTATCVPLPGSNFADALYPANCPASGVTMQLMSGGLWQSTPPLHCSDGKLPGSCGPGATVPGQYVFSTQRYGQVWSGAAIGSTQTVGVCDSASQCSRFFLTIPTCSSVVAAGDSFKISDGNNPLDVEAGGSSDANLVLDGPWVSFDHGVGAPGWPFDTGSLPPGMAVQLSPGVSGAPHTYGTIDVRVSAPANTPAGDYQFQAKATDVNSNVSLTTVVPVRVLACKPVNLCSASTHQFCGLVSNGCGGSTDCGACATGLCSNSVCCPAGSFYNSSIDTCQLNSCPAGTTFCSADSQCETYEACNKISPPNCQKVGGRIHCS